MVSDPALGAGGLEPAFTAPEAAAASLGFRGAAAEVHSSTAGGRAIVHERLGRTWRTISRLADPEVASVQFLPVQLFDGRRDGGSIIELDERKAARPVGCPVDRKKHLFDWSRFREECLEVSLGRFVAKVPDEYSRRNGEPPLSSAGSRSPVAGQTSNVWTARPRGRYRFIPVSSLGGKRTPVGLADRARHATPKHAPWAQHTPTVWETQSYEEVVGGPAAPRRKKAMSTAGNSTVVPQR